MRRPSFRGKHHYPRDLTAFEAVAAAVFLGVIFLGFAIVGSL